MNISVQFYVILVCNICLLFALYYLFLYCNYCICSCIVLLTSVNIFMTVTLNSLSGKSSSSMKVSFWTLILFPCLENFYLISFSLIRCFGVRTLEKTSISLSSQTGLVQKNFFSQSGRRLWEPLQTLTLTRKKQETRIFGHLLCVELGSGELCCVLVQIAICILPKVIRLC